jgi:transcriptional regulator GlxA family with amidase domain
MKKSPIIYILVHDQTMASSITGPIDAFHAANLILKNISGENTTQIQWKLVSTNGKSIKSSSGIEFNVDEKITDIDSEGWLYLPGVLVEDTIELTSYIEQHVPISDFLTSYYQQGMGIAANCTGTFLLAESGLLDGYCASTTWWLSDFFEQRYPLIQLQPDRLSLPCENIICGSTATAHLDLAIILIRRYMGRKIAHLCAKYMLINYQKRTQAPFQPLLIKTNDTFIQEATTWLRKNLNKDIRIEDLAQKMNVSTRTLIRRFNKATGESPVQYLQKLRIDRSKYFLETSPLSMHTIIERVGYQDESTFRRLFKKHTNLTPLQYRQRYAVS